MDLILASQSPRRSEILTSAGFKFKVLSVKVSESFDKNLNLDEQIKAVARTKGEAVAKSSMLLKSKDYLVLSADTVVVLKDRVFGKPESRDQAQNFLRTLRNQTHEVKTGVCFILLPSFQIYTDLDTSQVKFRNFSDSDLETYLDSNEWEDKAGGYAIQGLGEKLVEGLKGSRTNVVGLPLELVEKIMVTHGWIKYFRQRKKN